LPRPQPPLALIAAALLAAAFAACGDDGDGGDGGETVSGVEALPSSACEGVEYGGDADADALIASDLPMQGDSAERSNQMVDAIRQQLDDAGWKAGDTAVAFQACDDSIEETGEWDEAKCRENAEDYAANPDVIGVIGTYNSGCAAEMIPILNEAPDGGVAMVSPGNTLICLTQGSATCKSDEPDIYRPSGDRSYARVVPNDAAQGAGLAQFASEQGIQRPFILYAADDPTSEGQGETFRGAAGSLGLTLAGFGVWDPDAPSYTALMSDVQDSGADALVLAGLLEQNGAQLIKDKVAVLGPNDGEIALLAPDGFAQQATIDEAGPDSTGMFVSVPGRTPESLTGAGEDFVDQLQETVGDAPVELFAPYAGEATEVLLAAIEPAGADRAAVIEALFETEIDDGIVGSFEFKPSGDPRVSTISVSVAGESFELEQEVTPDQELIDAALAG
jgi:branched-chain amino acid transport system substrate-binding protein